MRLAHSIADHDKTGERFTHFHYCPAPAAPDA
ncbi:hypothetical protein SAMN05444417_2251 [Wenxinia saemankumensis]|uniref:Uncharacterized protein n=1 Tax=Wenxinia saemankumensis TaxID=1447782 RepID=A0A1M6EYQ7_9RHOB|nr:hypothetical protein SAMN05444417_2251 [Wenxinia saemankumensis]